jgi:hypothetical protein
MKRLLLIIIAVIAPFIASAQFRVVRVTEDADTLLYVTKMGNIDELIDLYKNKDYYMIKSSSSNIFDVTPAIYLGKTKEEAVIALKSIAELGEKDVATTSEILDAKGQVYIMKTTYMASGDRKPTFVKGDRVLAKNREMSGVVCLKKKLVEEIIKYLSE